MKSLNKLPINKSNQCRSDLVSLDSVREVNVGRNTYDLLLIIWLNKTPSHHIISLENFIGLHMTISGPLRDRHAPGISPTKFGVNIKQELKPPISIFLPDTVDGSEILHHLGCIFNTTYKYMGFQLPTFPSTGEFKSRISEASTVSTPLSCLPTFLGGSAGTTLELTTLQASHGNP